MKRRVAKIADETVTAYIDGVLDDRAAAAVEAAMAVDPELAARVTAERQLRRIRSKAPIASGAEIIRPDFRKPKPAPPAKPKVRRAPAWAAAVASIVIGLVVVQMFGMVKTNPFEATPTAGMAAPRALSVGLTRKLSGEAGAVLIGASFRDVGGLICRSFRIETTAGIACRRGQGWDVRMTAPATSGLPPAVNAAVAGLMVGEPLTRLQEIAARDAGWR